MKLLSAVLLICLVSTATNAAETINGVWSTQSGCDWLEKTAENPDAAWPDDFAEIDYLDASGITGYEWGCDFNSVNATVDGTLIAKSSCYMESSHWKQTMVLTHVSKGWKVTLYKDADETVYLLYDTQCLASK